MNQSKREYLNKRQMQRNREGLFADIISVAPFLSFIVVLFTSLFRKIKKSN